MNTETLLDKLYYAHGLIEHVISNHRRFSPEQRTELADAADHFSLTYAAITKAQKR